MYQGQRVTALLPLKYNSERVKGKNFREFNGKPLFHWILNTLLSVPEIDQVVINTDAREVLKEKGLPESNRILIRDRKPEICGDFVSMNLILKDDIENVPSDIYLMTHTTNPLLKRETVLGCLESYTKALQEGRADSVFTVNKMQTRFYREDASPVNHDPNNLVRTQDLEPWFEENSNLYVFSRESFAKTNARIGAKPKLFVMNKLESVDIDDQESWDLASAIEKQMRGSL